MNYNDDQLLALVRAGRKIEAIKAYIDATGAGLREAKDYVDRLEEAVSSPPLYTTDASLDERIQELCRQGKKLEAIKQYRDAVNCGLKEAKDYVERVASPNSVTGIPADYNDDQSQPTGFWQWLRKLLHGG